MNAEANGPFETREQASAVPAVRAAFNEAREVSRPGVLGEHNKAMLIEALDAAGVELGAFDRHIVDWLAGWEPHVIAVIASWIRPPRGLAVPPGYLDTFAALLHDGITYAMPLPPNTRGPGQAGLYRAMARAMDIGLPS